MATILINLHSMECDLTLWIDHTTHHCDIFLSKQVCCASFNTTGNHTLPLCGSVTRFWHVYLNMCWKYGPWQITKPCASTMSHVSNFSYLEHFHHHWHYFMVSLSTTCHLSGSHNHSCSFVFMANISDGWRERDACGSFEASTPRCSLKLLASFV